MAWTDLVRALALGVPLLAAGGCRDTATIVQYKLIGEACVHDTDCASATFTCDTAMAGGYCKKVCRNDFDCPSEGVCVFTTDATLGACFKRCISGGECRASSDLVCRDHTAASVIATHDFCGEAGATFDGGAHD
jgi:hypothetical protein